MTLITEKLCLGCSSIKSAKEFFRDRSKRGELSSRCRPCTLAGSLKSRPSREKASEYERRYRDLHRDEMQERQRRHRLCDPSSRRASEKRWRDANPEAVIAKNRRFDQKRRRSPTYLVRLAIARGIRAAIKDKKARARAFDLVGYSAADLRQHLESLFLPGMSWSNYGEWHVDHRRPCASFSFEGSFSSAVRECWSLSNLQPLWGPENHRKASFWSQAYWMRGKPHPVRAEPLFVAGVSP